MAGRKRKTLEQWVSERIDDPDRAPAKLSSLILFHAQGAAGRQEVHTVNIGRFAAVNAKEIAGVIEDMAATHAQDLQGSQMFEVLAYYGSTTTNPARFPMAIQNNPAESGYMTSEPPTQEGRMMQKMKWEEGFLMQLWRRQQAMDDTAIRREEVNGYQVARLQHELNDCYAIMRDMFIQTRKDDHAMAMQQMQYERDTVERKKILAMAPPLINTITGREIFPQETADTSLLEAITEALMDGKTDQSKITQMASSLPPTLQMTLFARMQEIAKKKNDEREEVRRLSEMQAKKDVTSDDETIAGALANGTGTSAQH